MFRINKWSENRKNSKLLDEKIPIVIQITKTEDKYSKFVSQTDSFAQILRPERLKRILTELPKSLGS